MRISDWSSDVCSSDLPSIILGRLGWIGIDDVLKPERKPVDVTLVDGEPMRRLPFDVMFVGIDEHIDRLAVLAQRREGLQREQIFVLGRLTEQRAIHFLRVVLPTIWLPEHRRILPRRGLTDP